MIQIDRLPGISRKDENGLFLFPRWVDGSFSRQSEERTVSAAQAVRLSCPLSLSHRSKGTLDA